MRLAAYAGVCFLLIRDLIKADYRKASAALAAGVVLKALNQRANFYSASVYLSQSSASVMVCMSGGS